mgnify:CR=1 FL=1
MGFAFENFDGVGKYRVLDARNPINATGQLPDGTKFDGAGTLGLITTGNPHPIAHGLCQLSCRGSHSTTCTLDQHRSTWGEP